MRYVENGVREDFASLTFEGLTLPLSELSEEEYRNLVWGKKPIIENSKEEVDFKLLAESVELLNLSARGSNCLKRAGVYTIGQLCKLTEAEVIRIRYMGEKSVVEIKERLAECGLSLNMAL